MNATRTQHPNEKLALKTSLAFITLAMINVALIPLMLGCDRTQPLSSANASSSTVHVGRTDASDDVYLPRRHAMNPHAAEGNVTTYERD